MTILAVILVAYACHRPLAWIAVRLTAFMVGFVVGWEVMRRR